MKYWKLSPLLLALSLVTFVSCAPESQEGASVDMASVRNAVDMLDTEWTNAFNSGDAAALAALYAENATYMPPYREAVNGRAAIQQVMTDFMSTRTDRAIVIEPGDMGASGDLVYVTGTYSVDYMEDGTPQHDEGKYVTISKATGDGSYEVVAHIWNTNLPEEMMESEMAESESMESEQM
jgi:uncharacterized protein (TIGR02246 family)